MIPVMPRPWKVIPGFGNGWHRSVTFDNAGTGIPTRSFATEAAARRAAVHAVCADLDPTGNVFAAVRVAFNGHPRPDDWDYGRVDVYEPRTIYPRGNAACAVYTLDVVTTVRTNTRVYRSGSEALAAIR